MGERERERPNIEADGAPDEPNTERLYHVPDGDFMPNDRVSGCINENVVEVDPVFIIDKSGITSVDIWPSRVNSQVDILSSAVNPIEFVHKTLVIINLVANNPPLPYATPGSKSTSPNV